MKRYIKANISLSDPNTAIKEIKTYMYDHYLQYFPSAFFEKVTSRPDWMYGDDEVRYSNYQKTSNTDETIYRYWCSLYLWPSASSLQKLDFQVTIVNDQITSYHTYLPDTRKASLLRIDKGSPMIDKGSVANSIQSIPAIPLDILREIVEVGENTRSSSGGPSQKYDPTSIDEDVLYFGADSYLNFLSDRYKEEFGVDPRLRVVKLVPYDGDDSEYTYKITFKDGKNHRFTSYIAFLNTGDGNWSWDNNVVDRSDWMNEIYDEWVTNLQSKGYL